MYLEAAIRELHKGFRLLNDHLFAGELPEPAISIQGQGRRKYILGWCSVNEIWFSADQSIGLHEINITAEYVNRPVVDVMETMLHEMVHLYNTLHGIKDVSRGGRYHNKDYKAQAEHRGLIVEHDKKLGWAVTRFSPETEQLIRSLDLDPEAFVVARVLENAGSAKQKGTKLICPGCKCAVRATKKVNLLCVDCNEPLEADPDSAAD